MWERTTLFFSGESAAAKSVAAALLTDLGWQPADILDLGGIRTAHATEHFIRMYYAQRDGLGTRDFNVRVVIRRDAGSGAAGSARGHRRGTERVLDRSASGPPH